MKSSIKLKFGQELDLLLENPMELHWIVKMAVSCDEETSIYKGKIPKKSSDKLIAWRLISKVDNGFELTCKKLLGFTKSRVADEMKKLKATKMNVVEEDLVPKELREYFKIAESFRIMIKSNLESIQARTVNVDNARFDKWVTPIRLMLTEDKITLEEMREVYLFLKGHIFWKDKIQSTSKVRKKFQIIYTQIKSNGLKAATPKGKARTTTSRRKNYK